LNGEAVYIKRITQPSEKKKQGAQYWIQTLGSSICGWAFGVALSVAPLLFSFAFSYFHSGKASFFGNFEIIYVLVTSTAIALSDSRQLRNRNPFFLFQIIVIILGVLFYSLCKMKAENPSFFPFLLFESKSFVYSNMIVFITILVLNMFSYLVLCIKRSGA
jgi:hypothetical protein